VIAAGATAVLETVLHDATHILNWQRGVKDLTTRGAYHTRSFLTTAEEVGLEWEEGAERTGARGYDSFVLSDRARERHAADLAVLTEVIPQVLPHLKLPTPSKTNRVSRLTLRCRCDPSRTFRISRTVAAVGPIICGVCEQPFTEE
jgi:hypothetical protein